MDDTSLLSAIDLLDNYEIEMKHLLNMLYIAEIGLEKNGFDCRKYAVGCIHIILKYVETLLDEYVNKANVLMENYLRPGNSDDINEEDKDTSE